MIGAGGHARVVADAMRMAGIALSAVASLDRELPTGVLEGLEHLTGDDAVLTLAAGSVTLVNGVGSVGDATARRKIFEKFRAAGFNFASVVHPSAVVGTRVTLGEGAQIMAGAVVQTGTQLGENCIINTGASVDHDCWVGGHAHIAPGACLAGDVVVGPGSHIGARAVIIQGRSVGSRAVVAAGAVVIDDISDGITVTGAPARQIRRKPLNPNVTPP